MVIAAAVEQLTTSVRPASTDVVVAAVEVLVGLLQTTAPATSAVTAVDRIAALDRLQAAAAGSQVVEVAAFARTHAQRGRPVLDEDGRGFVRPGIDVPAQVGLARKVSPSTAARQVNQAVMMVDDFPETLRLLCAGDISGWVASLVVKETSALGADDRKLADRELAPRLPSLGPARAAAAARRVAIGLDPASPLRRGRTARADRRVSIRPAPDTMTLLTGFLPVEQGVAAYAALDRHARTLRASGDLRSLGQIMADTLVERVTGQTTADAVPVEIGVTISLSALAGDSDQPASIKGAGPVPAQTIRDLIDTSMTAGAPVWVRRLVTDPIDHTIITVDTKRRRFTGPVAALVTARDQSCRMPFCTAPIRHLDHVEEWRRAGATSASNGQGLCEYHNYAKDQPGWTSRVIPGPRHQIQITTPTRHTYTSHAPPALGP